MRTVKPTTYRARTHRRLRGGAKKPAIKSAKATLATKNKFFILAKAHKEHEFFETMTDAELDTFAKALKSAKTKLAIKKSTRVKEFLRLAKAHKEREFFETVTHAELDTFAKALKMKLSDSREKKLTRIIAYSKKYKPVLILVNTSVLAMKVLGVLSPTLLYMLVFAPAIGSMYMSKPFLKKTFLTKNMRILRQEQKQQASLQEGEDCDEALSWELEVAADEDHDGSIAGGQADGWNNSTRNDTTQESTRALIAIIGAMLATGTLLSAESLSEMLKEFKRFQKALSALK